MLETPLQFSEEREQIQIRLGQITGIARR